MKTFRVGLFYTDGTRLGTVLKTYTKPHDAEHMKRNFPLFIKWVSDVIEYADGDDVSDADYLRLIAEKTEKNSHDFAEMVDHVARLRRIADDIEKLG